MTDLVKRLRDADDNSQQRASGSRIFKEAADTIEALEQRVGELEHDIARHLDIISEQTTQLAEKDKQLEAAEAQNAYLHELYFGTVL